MKYSEFLSVCTNQETCTSDDIVEFIPVATIVQKNKIKNLSVGLRYRF